MKYHIKSRRRCARRNAFALAVLLSGLLGALATLASQILPMSLGELCQQAEVTLQGRVLAKTCQRDDAGRIFTVVEVAPQELWRGSIADFTKPIEVEHGGGVVGEERSLVVGQARYTIGEEVVVFLRRNPQGRFLTVGLAQGKFTVLTNTAGACLAVPSQLPTRGEVGAAACPSCPRQPMPVEELKRRVHLAQP